MTNRINRRDFMMRSAAAMSAMAGISCAHRSAVNAGQTSDAMAELATHRIARIEQRMVRLNWVRLVGKNSHRDTAGTGRSDAVAIIHTDRGAMGWGVGKRMGKNRADQLSERLKGKPVAELFDPAVGTLPGVPLELDFALHDLAGIILNKPVYELMGGTEPRAYPCYSGMVYMDDLDPPDNPGGIDKVLANCQQDYDLGYRQFKLKIGRGHKWMPLEEGLARDVEVTRAIAKAFPDVALLVDGNDGMTPEQIERYLDGIAGIELLWIEEPFPENIEDFKRLRKALDDRGLSTLIADAEFARDLDLIDQLIEMNLLDVHMIDIEFYGFTPWRKLLPTLEPRGVTASPHTWGSQIRTYCSAHLAAALGNTLTLEGVSAESDDIDWGDYKLDKNGKLAPSTAPGFGMKLL